MSEVDINLFQGLFNADGSTKKSASAPQAPELPDEIIISGKNEVGSIIEHEGQQWLVSQCERETEVTPANARDEYDERLPIGWHSWLVKVKDKALVVVSEQVKLGKARFTGSTSVLFDDEEYAFDLAKLAYSDEIGLYQR